MTRSLRLSGLTSLFVGNERGINVDCCETMKSQVAMGNIDHSNLGTYIYGKADLVDDGDGHMDDMTPTLSISFCPFCGTKIGESAIVPRALEIIKTMSPTLEIDEEGIHC